jgi:hypothetical protein
MSTCRSFHTSAAVIVLAACMSSISMAAPFDGEPKILIHTTSVAGKNACAGGGLTDCANAVSYGATRTPHFALVLVARGNHPDVGGVQFGLTYGSGRHGDLNDGRGIDIFSWTLCGSLEFPTPWPEWPRPNSGNLITWDSTTRCQTGDFAVAGYFYLTAYDPDALRLTANPASEQAVFATCNASEHLLGAADLGYATFGLGPDAGCNPCAEPCGPPPFPSCSRSTDSIGFGTVNVGQSGERSFTVTNSGGGRLVGDISESSPVFEVAPSHYDLGAGESQIVTARFVPAQHGPQDTDLVFSSGCEPVHLNGDGYLPANCAANEPVLDFGTAAIGTEVYRSLVITNSGGLGVTIHPAFSSAEFRLIGHEGLIPCPSCPGGVGISPGHPVTLTIRFLPRIPGVLLETLDLGACGTVELRALVTSGTDCVFSPNAVDFFTVALGSSRDMVFHMRNAGSVVLSGTLSLSCEDFQLVGDPAYTLQPGEDRTFTARFTPTTLGLKQCAVDPGNGCAFLTLAGTGDDPPVCHVHGFSFNFTDVPVGGSMQQAFYVANRGGARLSGEVTGASGDLQIIGNSTFDLGRNQEAVFVVRFSPTQPGFQSWTLELGPMCEPLTYTGNGVGATSSAEPLDINLGDIAVGDSAAAAFVITNSGEQIFSGSSASSCPDLRVFGDSYTLSPGQSTTISLVMRPAAAGLFDCLVSTGAGQHVTVHGSAVSAVSVQPTTWSAIKTRFD